MNCFWSNDRNVVVVRGSVRGRQRSSFFGYTRLIYNESACVCPPVSAKFSHVPGTGCGVASRLTVARSVREPRRERDLERRQAVGRGESRPSLFSQGGL
eukprot:scaffold77871_cov62-Phaeocystis_antarctica.AAC.5